MRKLNFSEWLGLIGTVTAVLSIPWIGSLFTNPSSIANASNLPTGVPTSNDPGAARPQSTLKDDGDGPGFDCDRKATWAERTICGSAELWPADRQLHQEYAATIAYLASEDQRQLRRSEMAWINGMHRCKNSGDGVDCLQRYYAQRIAWLVERRR